MDPLPAAPTLWPALQTLLLISQTILLLTVLASHHFQPQDQILQAIHDAVGTAAAPRTPSTQALVEKAQHLVTELNALLLSIDNHHEEILNLRRRIQTVDQRILNPGSTQSSALPLADDAELRDPPVSGPVDERVKDDERSSHREAGGRSQGKRAVEAGDVGDGGGSEGSEEVDPEPPKRKTQARKGARPRYLGTRKENNGSDHDS